MKHAQFKKLVSIAKDKMRKSCDPVHDFAHVQRVAKRVSQYAKTENLTKQQTDALILAAWWHDVGRTSIKRPSIMIMAFFDDLISAVMLWRTTIRLNIFGNVVGMATRIIFCNSTSVGKPLTRILLQKKNRILADMLSDADTLDVLDINRIKTIHVLANSSFIYSFGYKMSIWFYLTNKTLTAKTNRAKKELLAMLKTFVLWIRQHDIYQWHVKQFGRHWIDKRLAEAETLIVQHQKHLHYSFV